MQVQIDPFENEVEPPVSQREGESMENSAEIEGSQLSLGGLPTGSSTMWE